MAARSIFGSKAATTTRVLTSGFVGDDGFLWLMMPVLPVGFGFYACIFGRKAYEKRTSVYAKRGEFVVSCGEVVVVWDHECIRIDTRGTGRGRGCKRGFRGGTGEGGEARLRRSGLAFGHAVYGTAEAAPFRGLWGGGFGAGSGNPCLRGDSVRRADGFKAALGSLELRGFELRVGRGSMGLGGQEEKGEGGGEGGGEEVDPVVAQLAAALDGCAEEAVEEEACYCGQQ